MENPFACLTVEALFAEPETIAAELFRGRRYPWEVLDPLRDFICALGERLDPQIFERVQENVWIARSAKIAPTAFLGGPLIVDEGAEIRHCAFLRGSAIVGREAVVGNSTELKNAVLFDGAQVPHFNYVGDSVLGFRAHLGAGAVTSNVKSDKSPVTVSVGGERAVTGRKKLGAILGSRVEVGCGSVLNPGTVIGSGSRVYPLSSVRGYIPPAHIFKQSGELAAIR